MFGHVVLISNEHPDEGRLPCIGFALRRIVLGITRIEPARTRIQFVLQREGMMDRHGLTTPYPSPPLHAICRGRELQRQHDNEKLSLRRQIAGSIR